MRISARYICSIGLLLSLLASTTFGQTVSTALILTNRKAKVLFDGEEKGVVEPNIPFKISTVDGEHYAQVQYETNGSVVDKGEIVVLEAGKQKIIKLLFDEQSAIVSAPDIIPVAELNFSIPGAIVAATWMNENPGKSYPYPTHYLAFEKGDEIHIDASMTNKNGTNIIEIATYPANVIKYTNKGFTELNDLTLQVEERAVYRFTLATNHAFDRNCILKISRRPGSMETSNFNTNVSRQKVYKAVTIVEPTAQWVNSGSNAAFGGKSRVLVPVSFPSNTVEWFYRFSASRSQADIDNERKNFQLFGELTKLLLASTGAGALTTKAVSIGVEQLSMPPGANYCDIYLLDYNNIQGFEAKTDTWKYILQGTRQNLMSGNVKVDCCVEGQYYLGIKNPATFDGINVSIEVTAVTVVEDWVMEAK